MGTQYIDFCKDLSKHPRGEWISTNKKVGEVKVKREGDIWIAKFIIKGVGTTEIKYRICINKEKKVFNESDPLIVDVTEIKKVVKGKTEIWYDICINSKQPKVVKGKTAEIWYDISKNSKQSSGSKPPVLGAS